MLVSVMFLLFQANQSTGLRVGYVIITRIYFKLVEHGLLPRNTDETSFVAHALHSWCMERKGAHKRGKLLLASFEGKGTNKSGGFFSSNTLKFS